MNKQQYQNAYITITKMCTDINLLPGSEQGKAMKLALELLNYKTQYNIITLCGSTKFKDKFIEISKKLMQLI